MIFKFTTHVALLFLVINSSLVYASETLNYNIHQQYVTPRSLGMGNTFSGIDDFHVMFYNPAGIAYLKESTFNFGIGAGTSKETVDFTKDIMDIADKDGPDADKVQEASDLLQSKYGDVFAARLPKLSFIYTRPKWAVALVPVDLSAAFIPHKLGGPALDVTAYQDTTLAFGYAKKSNKKRLALGMMVKAVYRANVDKSLLTLDLIQDSDIIRDEDYKEGFTVDADLGAMWAPWDRNKNKFFKYVMWPTFHTVLRNSVDYGFTSNFELYNDGSKEPERLQRRLDVGSSWELKELSKDRLQPRIIIDVRDIFHEYFSFEKGLHLGAELKYNVGSALKGSLQGGMSQGYWTAGVGLQTFFLKLELASYAEEYGTKSEKKTNRQYMAQLNFNF